VVPGTICSDERADGFSCAVTNAVDRKRFVRIAIAAKIRLEGVPAAGNEPAAGFGRGFLSGFARKPWRAFL